MADPESTMDQLLQRARAEGLWFWVNDIGSWHTADQFAALFPDGDLPFSHWGMAPPDRVIEVLRGRVDRGRAALQHAEAELARAIRAKREIDGAQ